MPKKSGNKARQPKGKKLKDLGPDSNLLDLEATLRIETGRLGATIEYVGGKKANKSTKLRDIWEGFAAFPKKASKRT